MKVTAVKNYRGARYSSLEEHISKRSKNRKALIISLAAALAMLATVLGGCRSIS